MHGIIATRPIPKDAPPPPRPALPPPLLRGGSARALATKPAAKKGGASGGGKGGTKKKGGAQGAKGGKKSKGMGVAPSVPMNKDMFSRIVLEESRRFQAMKEVRRMGSSKDEREVALVYAREMSKRRNRMDWAWETRAALRDAAIAALPTEQLKAEANTLPKSPLFPLTLLPPAWTPPAKSSQ